MPASAAPARPAALSAATAWIAPAAAGAVVAAAYIVFSAWQWGQYTVKSWDLGIFSEAVRAYSRLQPPIVPIKGDGFNLLGDHFHPLLAILAPAYAVFPHPFTLLVVQAVCFGIATAIVGFAAMRIVGPISGALLGLASGLSFGLQYAAEAQFHEIAPAVPLLAAALAALLLERWRTAVAFAALLAFVKEDLGVTTAVIGVLIAWRSGRRWPLWLIAWGLGWVLIATLVVPPLANPGHEYGYAGSLNPLTILSDPSGLFSPSKGLTLLLLTITCAGLAYRSPLALALLPTLAWRFLSTNYGYWGPTWHYSAVLMPIAFLALVDGIRIARASPRGWLRSYGQSAAAISITVVAMMQPTLPLAGLIDPDAWRPPSRAEQAAAVLQAIPAGATVESDIGLMSYAVDGHDVWYVGNSGNPAPDCILIDRQRGGTPDEWGDVLGVADHLHPGTPYTVRYDEAGYQLACRG